MTKKEQEKYKKIHEIFSTNAHITSMEAMSSQNNEFGLDGLKNFINAMEALTWWVEDFSDTKITLLTSDSPMRLIPIFFDNADPLNLVSETKARSIADALASKKFYLFIPLSPSIGFFAAPKKLNLASSKNALIKKLNLNIVIDARQFVIAKNAYQDNFIKKHFRHQVK